MRTFRGKFWFVMVAVVAGTMGQQATRLPFAVAQAAGQDYHLDAWGDPLDFSNREDQIIADDAMLFQTSNASIADGQLHFDADRPAYFSALWAGFPTGIPHGREGDVKPIDAGHYRRLVMRINSSAPLGAGVRWYTCQEANVGCQGGQNFALSPGWQTYDLALNGDPGSGLTAPWGGSIYAVRIVLAPNGPTHFDVDWMRIVPDGVGDVGELTGGAPPPNLPLDKLDYATYAGNAWDFDNFADVKQAVHLRSVRVADHRFYGCNTATNDTNGDPGMVMSLPGGQPIDANRFKTLTVVYSYEGPFSVKNVKGGGMVGRVFWFDVKGTRHATNGVHLYPNDNTFTIRLDGPGVSNDGTTWGGVVTGFRWDPNQDPSDRCWTVDRILLTADEPAGSVAANVIVGASPAQPPAAAAVAQGSTNKSKAKAKRSAVRAKSKKPTAKAH